MKFPFKLANISKNYDGCSRGPQQTYPPPKGQGSRMNGRRLRQVSKSTICLVWRWPLTFWSPKLNVPCPCSVDNLCQFASQSVHSFSKYRVGNRRTDGQVEKLSPPACLSHRDNKNISRSTSHVTRWNERSWDLTIVIALLYLRVAQHDRVDTSSWFMLLYKKCFIQMN